MSDLEFAKLAQNKMENIPVGISNTVTHLDP